MALPQIMIAPNGARMQKTDHPAVPVTKNEIVACAQACFAAGAGSIHAHIRDQDGAHLLDGPRYRELVQALRAAVPAMGVQITTEAAGRYDPDHQMQVALEAGADHVSVSIREISPAGRENVRAFIANCEARAITLQYILYDEADAALLESTLPNGDFKSEQLQLLFVLGRYGKEDAQPQDLDVFTRWMTERGIDPDWAVCAFGEHEVSCLKGAAQHGGKCRTGFENSIHLASGLIAPDNAAKVHELQRLLKEYAMVPSSGDIRAR